MRTKGYQTRKRAILVKTTTRWQFNIKTLLLVVFEVAILIASCKMTPAVHGFDLPFSRKFLLVCLLGALILSFVIALVKYPIASWRFTQSLIISTAVSAWIGYSGLLLHASQMSQAPQWPGMAAIYMFPASFLLSAVAAIVFSLCLPIQLMDALFNNNGKS